MLMIFIIRILHLKVHLRLLQLCGCTTIAYDMGSCQYLIRKTYSWLHNHCHLLRIKFLYLNKKIEYHNFTLYGRNVTI
jgi:hypothetical protein